MRVRASQFWPKDSDLLQHAHTYVLIFILYVKKKKKMVESRESNNRIQYSLPFKRRRRSIDKEWEFALVGLELSLAGIEELPRFTYLSVPSLLLNLSIVVYRICLVNHKTSKIVRSMERYYCHTEYSKEGRREIFKSCECDNFRRDEYVNTRKNKTMPKWF